MSNFRYIGGTLADPEIEEPIEEFTDEEILQGKIDDFLLEEEALLERMQELYRQFQNEGVV